MKSRWRTNRDKREALLEYRASPLPGIDLSPSQLSMERELRTTLPIARGLLEPETHSNQKTKARMKHGKDKQKYYHDRQGAKELPPLRSGDHVKVKLELGIKEWRAATVVQKHALPTSYVVQVSGQRIRRNRVALKNDSTKSHMGYLKTSRKHPTADRAWARQNTCRIHVPSKPVNREFTTEIPLKSLSCWGNPSWWCATFIRHSES